jgi:exodeoxyribonuclease-3
MPSAMKIATWNVNGIRARQAQLEEWMASDRPDVICLQEIKASPEQIPTMLFDMQGYWSYWHGSTGSKGYSGVSLHVKKDLSAGRPEFSHPPFDHESRIVVAKIGELTVSSVYVPNGGKDFAAKMRFLEALDAYAATFEATGAPLVLCGDINVARADIDVHPKERKPGAIGQLPEERMLIERIIARGMHDLVRDLHPEDADFFTWWAPWRNLRQRNIGWRIDYIFASASLAAKAKSCSSLREVGTSDHAPLVATFDA